MHPTTRITAALASGLSLLVLLGAPSGAAAAQPLACDASVISVDALGLPLRAGQAGTPGGACTNAAQSLDLDPAVPLGLLNVGATTSTAAARTTTTAGGAPIAADARLEDASVNVGSVLGALNVTADAIEAHVQGGCVDDYATSGQVVNLRINGTAVTENTPSIGTGLGLAVVTLNAVTRTATGVSRDAVRIAIPGVVTLVLGHAAAGGGDTCPAGTTPPVDTVGTPPSTGVGGTAGTPGTGSGTTGTPDTSTAKTPDNGTNASNCARIHMWFVPRQKHTRKYLRTPGPRSLTTGIEHGKRWVTRGRIVTCKGKPIIRARIDVFHVARNGKKMRKTGIRSRRDGLLTLILPSNLHTRTIRYEYRPTLKGKKVSAHASLTKVMRVHGRKVW